MSFFETKEQKTIKGSQLITRNSLLKSRLEDGKLNSRGLSSPRFFNDNIIKASAKTRIGNVGLFCSRFIVKRETLKIVAVPRLPDAISLSRLFFHGFKNPRLFALRSSRLPDAH